MENLRTFEISVWTIQDDFISVLESAYVKSKGKTQDGEIKLNIDGTQELSFIIPMYLYENGQKILNPSWHSVEDGELLINTRKIKVILNRNTEEEEIYEFVIDKITQIHENDELICEVNCTGLAFYELGKIGYKISLSTEDFYADDLKWFNKELDENGKLYFKNRPIANIQYWLDKFLTKLPNESNIYNNPTILKSKWYYTVQMDWSHYFNNYKDTRSAHKVYEDDNTFYFRKAAVVSETYIESSQIEQDGGTYKEKERMIDLFESNIYNLTQNIAETFGVYCKYIYLYDDEYHIKGRIIMFYNNFLFEDNELNVTYRYQTNSIKREIDSADLVTKMYVKTVEDYVSIIDVDENYSKEDFLLNFDYLYQIGTINKDAYDYIHTHESKLRNINIQLKPLNQYIYDLSTRIVKIKSKKTLLEEQLKLDDENIEENKEAIGRFNKLGHVEASHPDQKVLLQDPNSDGTLYYIDMTSIKGLEKTSLQIYKKLNPLKTEISERLTDELTGWTFSYDEFNNITQIENIVLTDSNESHIVYLTYDYVPKTHYENILKAWDSRRSKDKINYDSYKEELDKAEKELKDAEDKQKKLLSEKESEIKYFEELMGPALREGYWQPDNYSDYGDTYVSTYLVNAYAMLVKGSSDYDYFFWDEELFDNEQDIKYEIGIEQSEKYYPCLDLTQIWNRIYNNLDNLSFLYYDFEATDLTPHKPSNMKVLRFGSGAQVCFVKNNGTIKPVLILTGLETLDDETLSIIMNHSDNKIGEYDTNLINGQMYYSIRKEIQIAKESDPNTYWLILDSNYKATYPRICIESLSLKTSDTNLAITIDYNPIKNYEDYILMTRTAYSKTRTFLDENGESHYLLNSNYYITLKNNAVAKILTTELKEKTDSEIVEDIATHNISILFTFSNADSAIYKDGVNILKDSSKPQVSYEFTIDLFKENNCIKMPSKYLNHIVRINDYELKFENTKGYISGLTLNLDHPWQDTVEIKNYTTKFEDLFSTILAQTEAMKKTSYLLDNVSSAFTSTGAIRQATIQNAFNNFDFNYAFNNGKLTINEEDGIWAISDSGVVAMRGGGIFCATEKDAAGNWKWNTGIMPEGINGSLITAGQIDTSKLRIFAGDKIRFQMNEDGLFAYKSFFEDFDALYGEEFENDEARAQIINNINENGEVDAAQFVKYNENGLFLIAKPGARVLNNDKNDYVIIGDESNPLIEPLDEDNELKRVSISWDGLTLRNYQNERVFFADADTGDLTIAGTIYAAAGYIGPWNIDEDAILYNCTTFGESEGIYFGIEGLSFGDLLKINFDYENQIFNSFIINGSDNDEETKEDNFFFKISRNDEPDVDSDGEGEKFLFEIKNMILGQDLIDSITSNISSNIYYATEYIESQGALSIPDFPEDAPNGSIGILYSDKIDREEGDSEFKLVGELIDNTCNSTTGLLKPVGYVKGHIFGLSKIGWNITGSGERKIRNWPYCVVGRNKSYDNTHGLFVKTKANKKLKSKKSFTIEFEYRTRQPYDPVDYVNEDRKRSQGIVVSVYEAGSDGKPQKEEGLIATGTYKVPFSSGHIDDAIRPGKITLTATKTISKDGIYFIVFYSKLNYSKIYIDYNSVHVGNQTIEGTKRGLFIKSGDTWELLADNDGVPAYLMPKATKNKIGGVQIGDGLTITEQGILSADGYLLPIATNSELGGVKIGNGLTISQDGLLSVNQYILPIASSSDLGGVKVGSGLSIDANGILSATYSYTLPIASSNELGGIKVGNGLTIDGNGILSATYSYSLPMASNSELGGIKVGSGLTIDGNGVLSNTYSYILPIASNSQLGGIKIGNGLSINEDGVTSVDINSLISYTQTVTSGTLIGTLRINGVDYPIYIPNQS